MSNINCPPGYYDKTNGEAIFSECGEDCPGGSFTDGSCNCACVPNTLAPLSRAGGGGRGGSRAGSVAGTGGGGGGVYIKSSNSSSGSTIGIIVFIVLVVIVAIALSYLYYKNRVKGKPSFRII